MTLSDYMRLKQNIVFEVGSNKRHKQLLETLKELFQSDINSPRRYEQISTIGQLLQVLEIRDVLSENKVGPLKDIAEKLPNRSLLLNIIAEYEASHTPRGYVNYYAAENYNEEIKAKTPLNNSTSTAYGLKISPDKLHLIKLTITEEIGTFWRDFGRHLKINECKIQKIDKQNEKLMEKAHLLLEYYDTRADPQRWFFSLCEALEKSRRKDLSKKIQEIMTMGI